MRGSTRTGIRFVGGEIQVIIRQIQAASFASAVLSGGGETNGRFAEARDIDGIIASIYPLVLGTGLPVSGKWQGQISLELLDTRQLRAGVIHNRYKVLRD